ncbi:phospholipid-translocating atpase [Trichoderma arundinaceum]|uniref:Phospholipid-translocating atpase n=1 Tax=Trichoderma arundinaceum TaxID=490622 RepID=A0A395NVZ6_TRIAR|nr:phospholipid-translocating atpase [Trichoderma arundinaceum]
MAGGWGNKIMQDEPSFLVLDSTFVFISSFLLTVFHPGIFFPHMRRDRQKALQPVEEIKLEPGSSSEGIKISQ